MIKVDKGNLVISGDFNIVRIELALLIHKLHHDVLAPQIGEEESAELIIDTVTDGFKTREQIREENEMEIAEIKDELRDLVDAIFETIIEKKGGTK